MSDELLPCPFCGCEAHLVNDTSSDYQQNWTWAASCMNPNCWVEGKSFKTEEAATIFWNTRPKLQVVIGYETNGPHYLVAIKWTQKEAEKVQLRWNEIFDDTDIEEWSVGDEMEMQP